MITNKKLYYSFFKWHRHYSFHYSGEDIFRHGVCGLCALFNNKTKMARKKTYNTNMWFNRDRWHNSAVTTDSNMKQDSYDSSAFPPVADIDSFVRNLYSYVNDL